ncbi:MAG: ATP-grasp domain-containing protein [Deltaproteobacteria bacterium]|nr:ATP-grasp domain-containing protein [Deltaproteobacteria bacterium]
MAGAMGEKIFIANRGDIAGRIARTAQKLGLVPVCLTERSFPPAFLRSAVAEWIRVPKESPALFLDRDAMIAFAQQSGCHFVHPGFGFLSEDADFAEKVKKAGLIWVGPEPDVIRQMGDKAEARRIAEKAEVPCLRGLSDVCCRSQEDYDKVRAFVAEIGFPVLIKAAFGGGGKGMRIVREESGLLSALEQAASEALNAFGHGSLIVEQYCEHARHLEVQILGDHSGSIVVLGDRDCSMQRRHQKIIEEAPAPFLDSVTREALHEAGLRLATAVAYTSAGTVEFLLENRSDQSLPKIWFLEMNTRLQVEHPVTESIFGLDLVAWQIKIAQGERLPPEMGDRTSRGHSVEARIYGEDPGCQFLPSPGPVSLFLPWQENGLRWENGLDEVDEIPDQFDPMVARVIAHGDSREEALDQLTRSLARTFFAGQKQNLSLLQWLCRHKDFRSGRFDNGFVGHSLTQFLQEEEATRADTKELLSCIAQEIQQHRHELRGNDGMLHRQPSVREISDLAFASPGTSSVQSLAQSRLSGPEGILTLGRRRRYYARAQDELKLWGEGRLNTDRGPVSFEFLYEQVCTVEHLWILYDGRMYDQELSPSRRQQTESQGSGSEQCVAPVPGRVIRLLCQPGDKIQAEDAVMVLESMKMEFEVRAPDSGIVKKILVDAGMQVESGQLLVQVEPEVYDGDGAVSSEVGL